MFGIPKEKITKDALYESAKRLLNELRGLEDWVHDKGMQYVRNRGENPSV